MKKQLKVTTGGTEKLDILKFVLSLLVVVRHGAQYIFKDGTDCIMYHTVVSGLSTIAVPTFFCITGYFSYESSREKVMHQIGRILKLYLCWSLIYLPLNYYSLRGNNQSFMLNIAKYFQNAFFSGTYYHLWYLPAAIVALMLTYILKKRKYNIPICSILLCIGIFTGPYMGAILKYKKICSIVSMYQRIFVTTRNGIFIGTPFMLIGMVIKKYNKFFFKIPDITLVLLLLIGLVTNAIEALKLYRNFGNSINNILISDIFLAPILIVLVLKYSVGNKSYLIFRKLSTVVYCVHPIWLTVTNILVRKISLNDSAIIYIVFPLFMSVIVGMFLIWASKKVKMLNYLI